MKDFFKYLTAGDEDQDWGLHLNVAGHYTSAPNEIYPPQKHPTGYFFNWENGRTLNEYQIIFLTDGSGTYETEKEKTPLREGSIFIIPPNRWHRYKPNKKCGWEEHYIGFSGTLANKLMSHPLFKSSSVLQIGVREEIIDTYYKIFDLVNEEQPGFQQIASGLIVKLLGYLISFEKQKEFSGKRISSIIRDARFKLRQNVEHQIDLEQLSASYNIGYSYFRKMFKNYTGVSPHKYHTELKIMRAKELLLSTDKSIKEISYELGFQSIHYFSRLFKKKVGKNPTEFRN